MKKKIIRKDRKEIIEVSESAAPLLLAANPEKYGKVEDVHLKPDAPQHVRDMFAEATAFNLMTEDEQLNIGKGEKEFIHQTGSSGKEVSRENKVGGVQIEAEKEAKAHHESIAGKVIDEVIEKTIEVIKKEDTDEAEKEKKRLARNKKEREARAKKKKENKN